MFRQVSTFPGPEVCMLTTSRLPATDHHFSIRTLLKRVLAMMSLWTLYGLIVGSSVLGGNFIGIISGAIAGAIILPWLGMVLGLMGGPVKDSLLGGIAGALVATLYTAIQNGSIDSYSFNICLIIGGIIGGNFALFLALRKRLRLARIALTR
jgi:hypothetical protein